jgi:hypothetical protein
MPTTRPSEWFQLQEKHWRDLPVRHLKEGIDFYIKCLEKQNHELFEKALNNAHVPIRACITMASQKPVLTLGQFFAMSLIGNRWRVPDSGSSRFRVDDEWRIRTAYLPKHSDGARPDPGVLRGSGYRVGAHARDEELRREILNALVESRIPPLGNRPYYAEWGEPNSVKRLDKLNRTIFRIMNMNKGTTSHQKAVREWADDLNYLKTKYSMLLK